MSLFSWGPGTALRLELELARGPQEGDGSRAHPPALCSRRGRGLLAAVLSLAAPSPHTPASAETSKPRLTRAPCCREQWARQRQPALPLRELVDHAREPTEAAAGSADAPSRVCSWPKWHRPEVSHGDQLAPCIWDQEAHFRVAVGHRDSWWKLEAVHSWVVTRCYLVGCRPTRGDPAPGAWAPERCPRPRLSAHKPMQEGDVQVPWSQ